MSKLDQEKTVLHSITDMYDKFFQAERKVADFILKNPSVAVNANVSELANFSGVSDATVIRFCKHLGYDGYYQLRLYLSRDIGRSAMSMDVTKHASTSAYGLFRQIADNAISCCTSINEQVFQDVTKIIAESNMLYLAAAGNTSTLCMYFGSRIERLGIRCCYNLIPEHYMGHLHVAKEGDVLLTISKSGTSRSVVTALELAKEKRMKTVAVTGHRYSPVSRIADYLLLTASSQYEEELLPRTSCLSEMIVMEVLTQALELHLAVNSETLDAQEMLLSDSKF